MRPVARRRGRSVYRGGGRSTVVHTDHRRGCRPVRTAAARLARCWTPHRCWPCCPPSSRPVTAEASASATRCWHGWCAVDGSSRCAAGCSGCRRGSRPTARGPPQPDPGRCRRLRRRPRRQPPLRRRPARPADAARPSRPGAPHPAPRVPPLTAGARRCRDPPRRLQCDPGRRAPRRTGDRGGADCRRLPSHAAADRLGPLVDAALHHGAGPPRRSSRTTSRSSAGGPGCRGPVWRWR